ncbi:hypothetical protein LJR267_009030 [Paraburkholderia hospita]|jgi:hypothetical protein|uniref:hypothetical protein n=1 Tax=Paraburkholderia hospita TaxID=169430 RepID=UPI000B346409|nr:hypothetical protein [Paraburkholderia hospita]OUL95935.1 hypothetical protein CA601_03680 [Paraburkholderia hospita]
MLLRLTGAELSEAQRARKKAGVGALLCKDPESRKDRLHKFSTALDKEYGAIFVGGNVNASALVRTWTAKSVLDAGWSLFACSRACCSTSAVTPACGSMSSMKVTQP